MPTALRVVTDKAANGVVAKVMARERRKTAHEEWRQRELQRCRRRRTKVLKALQEMRWEQLLLQRERYISSKLCRDSRVGVKRLQWLPPIRRSS